MVARGQPGFRVAGRRCAVGTRQGRGLRACAADTVGHRSDQVARPDRLAQVIVGTAVEHFELALRVRVAAKEYDRQQLHAGLLADHRGQPHAIQPGQVQIHQDQVRALLADGLLHAIGIAEHDRLHAGAVQHALCEQRLGTVVFDDQHAVGRVGVDRRHVTVARLWQCCGRGQRRRGTQSGTVAGC
ncbi:hypothetical protein D3C73_1033050 [compost metagenome]